MRETRRLGVRVLRGAEPLVAMTIDGVSLLQRVRVAELPFARAEGVPALAGNYGWPALSAKFIRLLVGEPLSGRVAQGTLLNCDCGLAPCWPLTVQVEVRSRTVSWLHLQQSKRIGNAHAAWSYRVLQPLRFERAAYFDAIETLRAAHAEHAARGASAQVIAIPCAV